MSKYCFGVDVGGTTIKLGLFNNKGDMIDKWEILTNKENKGNNILSDISRTVRDRIKERKIEKEDVIGIGMGVPGPVDADGVVYKCVNLGWGVFNVRQVLEKLTNLTVKAGNDANVAALGEMWQGGGKGYKDVVLFTLGTGVGGGVILGGQMVNGANGSAGELGHMTIVLDEGENCNCGKTGCLETVASATGIVRETKKYLEKSNEESVLRTSNRLSARVVFDAAKNGDKVAIKMVEQLGNHLGLATAHIANVLNPEVFVIGGGVSKAGNILIDVITKNFKKYAFHAVRDTEFRLATLENDAGMIGAAKLILEN
ncbi:MAG: ROK family glucokinase [Eubacteriales bacterium]